MASIDYVSGTVQGVSVQEVLAYVSRYSEGWVAGRGAHGYKASWSSPGFRIFHDGAPGMGSYVQVSGEGCAAIASASGFQTWGDWFGGWQEFGFKTGRIDMAFDDQSGLLSVAEVERKFRAGECTTKYRTFSASDGGTGTETTKEIFYMGGVESDTMVCWYNKRLEQIVRGADDPGDWVRAELRFRHKAAEGLVSWLIANPDLVGAEGFLAASITFREPADTLEKDRWAPSPWWLQFLSECGKLRIQAVKPVRTLLQHVERFTRQHSATLACLVLCMCAGRLKGEWLDSLLVTGWGRLNKEQCALIHSSLGHTAGTRPLVPHY